jgi:glycine/D-amino acid oxidase-like deaminating enzyme
MADFDVAVIGAGVFGAWTAWHLCRAGRRVLLVDAWGAGHSRSSSGGESRIIRMGYGADEIYTRMAMRSLDLWRQFDIFVPTGVLWMARESDPYSRATLRTLQDAGVQVEVLAAAELNRRWPQFRAADPDVFGIFEPGSGALLARRAVQSVVRDAVRQGVEYRVESVLPDQIDRVAAGTFVFACGPWLPKLFPDLLGSRIWPTRQEIFFFAPPSGDASFAAGALPVWIDFTHPLGAYGFPDIEARGCKLAFDRHGDPFDPDTGDRTVSAKSVAEAREFMASRFPALRDAPLTETRVCQYENTSSGDFLIDRHPDHPNVWLVGGGSGHGFKHGPAVGEYVMRQILQEGDAEPRFSLASKEERQRRSVY